VTVRLVVENAQVKEAIVAQIPRLVNLPGNVTVEVRTRAEAQEAESGKNEGRSRGGQDQQPEHRARNEAKFEMQGVSDASR
jgi:flagellar hook-length control protein FliK